MGSVSKELMQQVEAVLPSHGIGINHQDIRQRVDMWAPVTIKHAIRCLVEEGRAKKLGEHPNFRYLASKEKTQ